MIKQKYISLLLFAALSIINVHAQTLNDLLTDYATNYSCPDVNNSPTTYKGYSIDSLSNTLVITFGGGFAEQPFTEGSVHTIYKNVKKLIPDEMRDFKLSIVTEDHPIEFLVPNSLRSGNLDNTRQLKHAYSGSPWVKNISRPYTASRGLENNHISLWQSHGRYWRFDKADWYWQRPRLFCTTEDLLTQTFVIPYIIPMLQNAGAVVFTPRERDYQNHEVIVDNDQPNKSGTYVERTRFENSSLRWFTSEIPAFKNTKEIYNVCDTPFVSGSARYIPSCDGKNDIAIAQWVPKIPENGRYAVYVTYPSMPKSVDDAHYVVFHKGGMTEFKVNQRIGGGTWVYLGTFEFEHGEHDSGKVMLTNESAHNGIVCADAVKFGGGMGNILPATASYTTHMEDTIEVKDYTYEQTGFLSGLPRYAEAAKYSAMWYGMPYRLHTNGFDNDEYKNDIWCRSQTVNELTGGSIYNKDNKGRGVPFELNLAFHTDAGYERNDFIGSLGIYMTNYNEGLTASGMDRYVSRDLSSSIMTNLTRDLKKYNWKVRKLWNRDYGEARAPLSPAIILEMLSHQNFVDMQKAYDPKFKFDFSRSVYKSIVKFLATVHSRPYEIQPLPVRDFTIRLDEEHSTVHLAWSPTNDPLEPTAVPTEYILYTRQGTQGFDNGQIVKGTSTTLMVNKGQLYSFKISALNRGGESFPSEILSAYISPKSRGKILVVNGFTRLEGPAYVNNDKEQGFRLDIDPGVPYGEFTGFCGKQKAFDIRKAKSEASDGLGQSGSELEGKTFMGNTFDYTYIHGQGIASNGNYSFCSTSESALRNKNVKLSDYSIVDVIFGTQKYFDQTTIYLLNEYRSKGGKLLVSGANIADNKITELSIDTISGCGTSFTIYRGMNAKSYAVPSVSVIDAAPSVIQQPVSAFPMLAYSNNLSAGTAYSGKDYKSIVLGFPLESIKEQNKINSLMSAFIAFLTAP